MNIEKVDIGLLKLKEDNPRFIKGGRFRALVKSVKEFPQMMEIRPIVVDDDWVVLGGNQRLKACLSLGWKEVWVVKASSLTEEQKREFVIKDNVSFGEWHLGKLADEWGDAGDWGLDVKIEEVEEKEKRDEGDACSLMIHFESEQDREEFVMGGGLDIKKKIGKIWRANYINNDINLF